MTSIEFRRTYRVGEKALARCATKRVYLSWDEAEAAALELTEDIKCLACAQRTRLRSVLALVPTTWFGEVK